MQSEEQKTKVHNKSYAKRRAKTKVHKKSYAKRRAKNKSKEFILKSTFYNFIRKVDLHIAVLHTL